MIKAKVIDLSHNNADVQFGQAKDDGVIAVFFKATQGSTFADDKLAGWVKRARSVGLRCGAYHFLDDSPASSQWANFRATLVGMGPLIAALDFETNPVGGDATAPIDEQVMMMMLDEFNRHPVQYGSDFLPKLASGAHSKDVTLCPLWQARYGSAKPIPPAPFKEWAIWQYSEFGPLAMGGQVRTDIDLSTYNTALFADDAAFLAWWDAHAITVP